MSYKGRGQSSSAAAAIRGIGHGVWGGMRQLGLFSIGGAVSRGQRPAQGQRPPIGPEPSNKQFLATARLGPNAPDTINRTGAYL